MATGDMVWAALTAILGGLLLWSTVCRHPNPEKMQKDTEEYLTNYYRQKKK